MKDKTAIILLHGAGLGNFIWKDLEPLLKYRALPIAFPRRQAAAKGLLFIDYVDEVLKKINASGAEEFFIVSHSIAGCVGLAVAQELGGRLKGFVALSAAIPQHGGSFLSCFPFPQRLITSLMMSVAGTKPPDQVIAKHLCNDLSEQQTQEVVSGFTPESKALYTGQCEAPVPKTKTLYIKCANDQSFPLKMQEKMIRNLGPDQIEIINSGHLPMMSQPVILAEVLNRFFD